VLAYDAYKTLRREPKAGTRNDLKSALAAATAAYHFREHLPNPHKKSRSEIEDTCPDYGLLGDVVNASKHKDVTRGKPKVTSADKIVEHVVYTQYRDESGHYMAATKAIEIALIDGTTRELFDVQTNVVNMWMDFLAAAGISEKMKPFAHEDRNRIISRDEAGKMNLAMTQGIACDLRFKMQKYNYEKGFPEPWDLSGHNISFNVYDPTKMKTELTVQLTNPEGKKYVADIELDAEEKAEFYLLQGTSQEDEFKGKVIKRRGEVTLHSDQTDLPGPNSLILKYAEPSDSEKK
jgi:hypothetical protein